MNPFTYFSMFIFLLEQLMKLTKYPYKGIEYNKPLEISQKLQLNEKNKRQKFFQSDPVFLQDNPDV